VGKSNHRSPKETRGGERIAFIDLFAGPGRYGDGSPSTPLLVLTKAIANEDLRERLVTVFNDKNGNHVNSLQEEISSLEGIEKLRHEPRITNHEIGEEIVQEFETRKFVPTLLYVDPWGYKGLTLKLVHSVLKDWGCDCILFFNYNRINMGLNNPLVKEHMDALFGEDEADELRRKLEPLGPKDREMIIVEKITRALRAIKGKYPLPFGFRNDTGRKTRHHLIFVSKHFKGFEIMKNIMAKHTSESSRGAALFEYNPASEQYPLLFSLNMTLEDLGRDLLKRFSSQTLSMQEIYERHSVDTLFFKADYKKVLRSLWEKELIRASKFNSKRKNVVFPDGVRVTFP
jgi:three-Cys-motif partner protein